jgi:hypothetical protein
MKEPDYIEFGMIEAEKNADFSVVHRGALSPDSVAAQYRSLQMRPPLPYVAPPKPVEIPNTDKVLSVEVKRVLVVASVLTPCGIAVMNGAIIAQTIAAAVAPVAAIGVGVVAVAFALSCLGNIRFGRTVIHEHHHHKNEYKQYNNSNDNSHA